MTDVFELLSFERKIFVDVVQCILIGFGTIMHTKPGHDTVIFKVTVSFDFRICALFISPHQVINTLFESHHHVTGAS